jgi:hypothetical protein
MRYGLEVPNAGVYDARTLGDLATLAEAGATWWMESIPPGKLEDIRIQIKRGPLRID